MEIPDYESITIQGGLNSVHFVGNILCEVFGIQPPVYIANAWFRQPTIMPKLYKLSEEQAVKFPNYEKVSLLSTEESKITSTLETPVFGDITFEAGQYNVYNKNNGCC